MDRGSYSVLKEKQPDYLLGDHQTNLHSFIRSLIVEYHIQEVPGTLRILEVYRDHKTSIQVRS